MLHRAREIGTVKAAITSILHGGPSATDVMLRGPRVGVLLRDTVHPPLYQLPVEVEADRPMLRLP